MDGKEHLCAWWLGFGVLVVLSISRCAPEDEADSSAPSDADPPIAADPAERLAQDVMSEVLPVLESTLEKQERQSDLPEKTYTWRPDQQSNRRDIEELLDEAFGILDTSLAHDLRDRVRSLEDDVENRHARIQELRQQRIGAVSKDSLGRIDRVNPLVTTREEIDNEIASEESAIAAAEESISRTKEDLRRELKALGLSAEGEEVDVLLSTVTGDDQISLAAVYQNIRRMAVELEQITVASGESLDSARRYYGIYVVLLQVLDLAHHRMIESIDGLHLPKLAQFRIQADQNIDQAEEWIAQGEGEATTLRQNIEANRLTQQVIDAYKQFLIGQRQELERDNEALQQLLRTAENTFATVKLSSRVAELVQATRRDLQLIGSLEVPPLRGFANEELRAEFRRLSDAMVGR